MRDEREISLEEGGRYSLVKPLGQGSFGVVVLAQDNVTGELVAIKRMERAYSNPQHVRAEVLNHSALHHPHVVGFRSVFLSARCVNIVMEYAPGGTLLDFVRARRRLREPLARWFFQQLLVAVDYCHRKGVANRDIKLDNLLLVPVPGLPQPLVKVCDFGYSRSDQRFSKARSKVGTLTYIAPEVLHNSGGGYDAQQADVFSCGVVLYAMLTGRFPFAAPPRDTPRAELAAAISSMVRDIAARRYALPADLGLSPDCVDLLHRLLEPEPKARITVGEVLKHPWFVANLPPAALSLNDRYLRMAPPRRQTELDVRTVADAIDPPSAGGSSDDDSASTATAWR